MLLTPQIQSPSHDSTTFDSTPTISWSADSGATSYEIWISQLGQNQGAVLIQDGITSTSFTVPNALNAQEHRVWVRSYVGTTAGSWSTSSDFFVSDQTTSVSAPPHNSLGFDSTPTISWHAVTGAESYEVWISEVGGSAVLIQGGVTGTSFTVPIALSPQEHRVWVRPEAAGTSGSWSVASDFFVSNDVTSVTSPSNHATTFDRTPTITWSAVTGAQSYEVWISEAGGSTVLLQSGVVGTSFTVPSDLNVQEHRVWVRPEANGTSGLWSSSLDFFISEDTASVVSPAHNGTSFSQSPTISWSPVTGAESYELWISEVIGGTVLIQGGITSTSFTVPVTLNEEEHRVWVRPYASGAFGEWSTASDFDVSLAAPVVTSPVHLSSTFSAAPTISWSPVTGAQAYEIWVSEIGVGAVLIKDGISSTSYTIDGADTLLGNGLNAGKHRVWVRAIDVAGEAGPWGSNLDFTISADRPVITGPGPAVAGSTALLKWTGVEDTATEYTVWVDDLTTSQTKFIYDTQVTTESHVLAGLQVGHDYRAWVQASDSVGVNSGWSFKYDFSVVSAFDPQSIVEGDFDGDGVPDMVRSAGDHLVVGVNSGDSLVVEQWPLIDRASGQEVVGAEVVLSAASVSHIGDFNGDGADDLLVYDSTQQKWALTQAARGKFFYEVLQGTSGLYSASLASDPVIADFNADGRDDIAFHSASTGSWTVYQRNKNQFTDDVWESSSSTSAVLLTAADVNGDGRDDIVRRNQSSGEMLVAVSTGNAFVTENWGTWQPGAQLGDVQQGDVDGDGYADIVARNTANGAWLTAVSTGAAFSTASFSALASFPEDATLVDVTSDGRADLVAESAGGDWKVAKSGEAGFSVSTWQGPSATEWFVPLSFDDAPTVSVIDYDFRRRIAMESVGEIRNTIEFTPSFGALKGAAATMETKAGNAWDQASVLADQLEGIVETRLKSGRMTLQAEDFDALNSWLGTYSTGASIGVLEAARLEPTTTLDGGGAIASVEFEHAWVEAKVPTSTGLAWFTLDPSFKLYARQDAASGGAIFPGFDLQQFLDETSVSTGTMDFESSQFVAPSIMTLAGGGYVVTQGADHVYRADQETEFVHKDSGLNGSVNVSFPADSWVRVVGRMGESSEIGGRLTSNRAFELYRRVNGSDTVLASTANNTFPSSSSTELAVSFTIDGAVVSASVNGHNLSAHLGGPLQTDPYSMEEGFFGIVLEGTDTDAAFVDDFSVSVEVTGGKDVMGFAADTFGGYALPPERRILHAAPTNFGVNPTRVSTRAATGAWLSGETTLVSLSLVDGATTTSLVTSQPIDTLTEDSITFDASHSSSVQVVIPGQALPISTSVSWSSDVAFKVTFQDAVPAGSSAAPAREQLFVVEENTLGAIDIDVAQHTLAGSFKSLETLDSQFSAIPDDSTILPEGLAHQVLSHIGQTYLAEASGQTRQWTHMSGNVAVHPYASAGMVATDATLAIDAELPFYVAFSNLQMDQPGPLNVPVSNGYYFGLGGAVRIDSLEAQALLLSELEATMVTNATGTFGNSMAAAFGIAAANDDTFYRLTKTGSNYLEEYTNTLFSASQLAANLEHSAAAESDVTARLAAGYTVVIPKNEVVVNDWVGTPFLIIDSTASVPVAQTVLISADGIIRHGAVSGSQTMARASALEATLNADPFSGILKRSDLDVTLPSDGLPLSLSRTWRADSTADGGFGQGWSFLFSEKLVDRDTVTGLTGDGYLWISAEGSLYSFLYDDVTDSYTTPSTLPGASLEEVSAGNLELTLKDGSVRRFRRYKSGGQDNSYLDLKEQEDRHGNLLRAARPQDTNSTATTQLTGIFSSGPDTTSERELLSFSWTNDTITEVADHTGRRWVYGYETTDNVARLVTVDGPLATGASATEDDRLYDYAYVSNTDDDPESGKYLLTQASSASQGVTTYEYFHDNRLRTTTTADGGTYRYRYDQPSLTTTILDPSDRPTRYHYSADGSLLKTVYSDGSVTENEWDHAQSQLTYTHTTGLGASQFTYDANGNGNLLSAVDPTGIKTTYTYEPQFHQVLTVTQDPTPGNPASGDERVTQTYAYSTTIAGAEGNPISSTNALGETTTFTYTAGGKVKTVTTPRGNQSGANAAEFTTTFTYDVNSGAVTGTQLPGSTGSQPQTSSTVDVLGRTLTSTDETGVVTTFTYDSNGQVLSKAMADPYAGTANAIGTVVEFFSYGPNRLLSSRTNADDTVFRYEYDAAGRIQREIGPDGSFTEMQYNADGTLAASIDAAGEQIRYVYDSRGRQSQIVYPDGSVVATVYDVNGNAVAIRDQRGNIAHMEYDNYGRLVEQSDALGNITTTEYDEFGRVDSVTDPRSVETVVEYDALDRVIRSQTGDTLVTSFQFDANGNTTATGVYDISGLTPAQIPADLNSLAAARKRTTSTAYDQRDRAYQWTDAAAQVRSITMDAANRVTSETNEQSQTTNFEFDGLGRLHKTVLPAPASGETRPETVQILDSMGRVISSTDAENNTTQFVYDDFGRQSSIVNAIGGVTAFEYDVLGRKTQSIDALGRTTISGYDALNRSILTAFPAVETDTGIAIPMQSSTHDAAGNVIGVTDALGRSTTSVYDALNRAVSITQPDPDGAGPLSAPVSSTAYDSAGNVASTTDALGRTKSFAYDELNRRITVTLPGPNPGDPAVQTSTEYDAFGNVTAVVDGAGHRTEHEYDVLNRRIKTTLPDPDAGGALASPVLQWGYDEIGNTRFITDALGNITEYQYDNLGRKRTEILADPDGAANPLTSPTFAYTYDLSGNLVSTTDALGRLTEYVYDDLNRRTTVKLPAVSYNGSTVVATQQTTYDAVGNVLTQTDAMGRTTQFEYDSLNRRTKTTRPSPDGTAPAPVSTSSYDLVGNVVRSTDALGRVMQFVYDDLNRLSQTILPDPDDGGPLTAPTTSRQYDAVGNVVQSTDALGRDSFFVYDAWNRQTEHQAPQMTYLNALRAVNTDTTYDVSGNVLSVTDPMGNTISYEYDNLNRRIKITQPDPDGAGPLGTSVTTTSYDAAGNKTTTTDAHGHVTQFEYDNLHRLISTTQPDPDGPGPLIVPPSTLSYDAVGNVVESVDPMGRSTTFVYDAWNRLTDTELPDPDGSSPFVPVVESSEYDLAGNIISKIDGLGRTTVLAYDNLNRQTALTLPDPDDAGPLTAAVTTNSYDAVGNLLEVSDQGRITTFAYDNLNRQISSMAPDPDGAGPKSRPVTTQEFDAAGNLLTTTDPLGRVVTYVYDSHNRRTDTFLPHPDPNSTDPGPHTQAAYDLNGNLIGSVDALGHITSYSYDTWNRQVTVTLPDVDGTNAGLPQMSTTTYYDAVGNIIAEEDHLGRRTEWEYDNLGRRIRETLPDADQSDGLSAPETTTTYDPVGNVLSVTDALGRVTSFKYDDLDRLTITHLPEPDPSVYQPRPWSKNTYDAVGNITQIRDVRGGTSYFTFDAWNRQTSHIAPTVMAQNATTLTVYDQYGNKASQTDPNGNSTSFEYDQLDRLIKVTHPAVELNGILTQPVTTSEYDAVGNLIETVDAHGLITRFSYDDLNRQISSSLITDSGGSESTLLTESSAYDFSGNVVAQTDALGRTTTFEYDALNRKTKQIRPRPDGQAGDGPTVTLAYDSAGNLASRTDALGNSTSYGYDRLNRVISETLPDPDGAGALFAPVTTTAYDNVNNVVSTVDHVGRITSFEYDGLNRMFRQTLPDPDGAGPLAAPVLSSTYDNAGNVLTATDAKGNVVSYAYDALGRKTSETLPPATIGASAAVSQYTYDLNGNLTQFTDSLGRVTTYEFDALNRETKRTLPDPDGAGPLNAPQVISEYDLLGNVLATTDHVGRTTSYAYDDLYRLTSETLPDPDGAGGQPAPVTGYTYDLVGNQKSRTDANGNVTTWDYDDLDRQILERQPNPTNGTATGGPETTWTYDAVGNLTSSTDPEGRTTSYTYDDLHRQVTVTGPDPDGAGSQLPSLVTTNYNDAGKVSSSVMRITATTSQTTSYLYDALDRKTRVTDDRGAETKYEYDANDNVVKLTDAEDNVTSWAYDNLNRVTQETNPLNDVQTFEYDLAGRKTATVDRRGLRTEYEYDDLDRLITEEWLDGSTTVETIDFTYNNEGLLSQTSDSQHTYGYDYDDLDRLTEISTVGTSGLSSATLDNVYDLAGNLTSRVQTVGTDVLTTSYVYDRMNRLKESSQSGNGSTDKAVTLTWNDDNQPATISRYSNLARTELVTQTDYSYDAAGRLTDLDHSDGSTILAGYDFTYNAAGWITTTDSVLDQDSDFTYDNTGQLVSADHHNQTDEAYSFDLTGNRIGTQYVVGAGNRVEKDGTYAYEYDEEGNRTKRTELISGQPTGDYVTYEWDHRNRLVSVTEFDASGTQQKQVSYTYDVNGMRISRSVTVGGSTVTTGYLYDDDQLVAELSSSGTVEHQYFDGPGIDQIFADEDALGDVLWPLADAQGTVRDLANVNSGITSILNHRTVDSFGNIVAETDSTVDHSFAFAGRYLDEDTGLYYNRARWYDQESGTFISEDPLGFGAGDTNITRYSGNNPVNYIDPTGLFWKKIVNVFRDVVDDVGDFFEDAFDDIGDAFEDVGDFVGEQWDNGNIQKVLLGAATIVSAGTFAPLAMGGFSALAAGGTFAGGFASAAATGLGLASVAASPGLVAAYAASTTLGFASAGVSAYEVFSGDQIGDGTLGRVLNGFAAFTGGIVGGLRAATPWASAGSIGNGLVSGYEAATGDVIGNGLLSGTLNLSNLGLNQGRYLVDPNVPGTMRAQIGLNLAAGAGSMVNTGDRKLQDALRVLSIVNGVSATGLSVRQAAGELKSAGQYLTRALRPVPLQTAPSSGRARQIGYRSTGTQSPAATNQGVGLYSLPPEELLLKSDITIELSQGRDPYIDSLFSSSAPGYVESLTTQDWSVLDQPFVGEFDYSGTTYALADASGLFANYGNAHAADMARYTVMYEDALREAHHMQRYELQVELGRLGQVIKKWEKSYKIDDSFAEPLNQARIQRDILKQQYLEMTGEWKPVSRPVLAPDPIQTDFEAGRTWLDNYVIDPVAGWGTGHANVVTFGLTDYLQGEIYGQEMLAYNQSGWSYTIGMGTGVASSIVMGYGAFANGGRLAAAGALRQGLQGWTVVGDVVGVAQSSYNVLTAQESWSDGLGFLPVLGAGSASIRGLRGTRASVDAADSLGHAGQRVSQHGLWKGSKRLSHTDIEAYRQTLQTFGVKLKRGHAVTRMLKKAGARAGFDSFENVVYLRKNATFYDAFHELKHVEHRALLGQAEYRRIGEYARESHVFNEVWRNRERFNRDELLHAIEYIRDERTLFRRGGID